MKPEDKALTGIVVAVIAVTGFAGAYFLTAPDVSVTLVLRAGTRFQMVGYDRMVVYFDVPGNATLVGSWSADAPVCARVERVHIYMIVVAPISSVCGTYQDFNNPLRIGSYTLTYSTLAASQNPPSPYRSATVTVFQTIRAVGS